MSICSVEGCGSRVKARGLCNKHYLRQWATGSTDAGPKGQAPLFERLMRKVVKGPSCWEWTGNKTQAGYGRIQDGGKGGPYLLTHRASYAAHVGPIPTGAVIMHTCDNPSCVNPEHLVVGTHKDNTQDMLAKGRHARMAPIGTENGKAVLTPDLVRYIRSRPDMSHAALARELGVGVTTIRGVRSGRVWSHVK